MPPAVAAAPTPNDGDPKVPPPGDGLPSVGGVGAGGSADAADGAEPPRVPPPRLVLRGGERSADETQALAHELNVPLIVAHLLLARGIEDPTAQRRLMDPRLAHLRRPDQMAGFPEALALLERACNEGFRVGVFGDYDVDGVTTATILTTFLEALGLSVVARVAHRNRGYGLGLADAEAFVDAKVDLLITGDCGTSDIEALGWLAEQGLPTVVIDHHQVPEQMPPCAALINPHQPDCEFPFKGMCSAGVAFYLCAALRTRLAKAGHKDVPDPRQWLDLVALATVCDMMPLVDENRVLVTHGLRSMGRQLRPGLQALLRASGKGTDEDIDEETLGFRVGPRINAPGRLGPAEPSLRLLRAGTEAEALPLAEQIETLNARRKRLQQETRVQALALLEADPKLSQRAALVVAHDGWEAGVVGIAAAGVVDHHRRPALILAIDRAHGVARGSVRSYGGVDVRAALSECASLLVRFGGHREAAGATVAIEQIDALTERFDAAVAAQTDGHAPSVLTEEVDAILSLDQIDEALVEGIGVLRPYGVGFVRPRFACDDVLVDTLRVLKQQHVALTVRQGTERRDAIAFGQAHHQLRPGERIGCIFAPQLETFRGRQRLKLHVERMWRVE